MTHSKCGELLEDDETFCGNYQAFPCLGCLMPLCRAHEHDVDGETCDEFCDMLDDADLSGWWLVLQERLADLARNIDSAIAAAKNPETALVCFIEPLNPQSAPLYQHAIRALGAA